MREKFKFMANSFNVGDVDLNYAVKKMVVTYNMKPVLGRPQTTFYEGNMPNGTSYFETSLDVNRFPYFSTKTLHSAIPIFKKIIMDMGFVLEGRCEEELPESMLGVMRIRAGMDLENPEKSLEDLLARCSFCHTCLAP
jgi:hypothetical protein